MAATRTRTNTRSRNGGPLLMINPKVKQAWRKWVREFQTLTTIAVWSLISGVILVSVLVKIGF